MKRYKKSYVEQNGQIQEESKREILSRMNTETAFHNIGPTTIRPPSARTVYSAYSQFSSNTSNHRTILRVYSKRALNTSG